MWTGWKPENDVHKFEFRRKVMEKDGDKFGEDLVTVQKTIETAAGKVAHCTEAERENIFMATPENVRLREKASSSCTKRIKRKVLKKQANKARAEHLVNVATSEEEGEKETADLTKGNFTEDRSCRGTVNKCTLTRRSRKRFKKTELNISKRKVICNYRGGKNCRTHR